MRHAVPGLLVTGLLPVLVCSSVVSVGASMAQAAPPMYPDAARGTVVDDYFGTKVADPYRWLEDDNSPQTKAWVAAENKLTFGFLDTIPQRAAIRERIKELWNYEKFSAPSVEGGKYFYRHNSGLQPQSVLLVADSLDAQPRVLLDPNTLTKDGTADIAGLAVTDDAKYLAYAIAEKGSDWDTWYVRDVASGKDLPDVIHWVKFSEASWTKDDKGFFYSRFDKPADDKILTAMNTNQKVYYHALGTEQDKDVLVYQRKDEPYWEFGAGVTDDGRYLVMHVSDGTDKKNRFFYKDLQTAKEQAGTVTSEEGSLQLLERRIVDARADLETARNARDHAGPDVDAATKKKLSDDASTKEGELTLLETQRKGQAQLNHGLAHGFVELLPDFDASYEFIDNDGPVFYFHTDLDAPRGKVIAINTNEPAREKWKTIVPESESTIVGVNLVGGTFIVNALHDAHSEVKVYDKAGTLVRTIALPGIGTAGGFGGKAKDTETFYSFTSYTTPPTIFRYDTASGASTVFKAPAVAFNPGDYETRQVFYASKDGTKVPMFITSKKGLKLDGNNPTLLYGYGGFAIPMQPGFSPSVLQWMEMGGVYAVANIRGGSEYGEAWHQAGTKLHKQNVFDDFIAAAEWLIANKYTQSAKLAIEGGSNGGLLIGACITQRPDLYRAALPAVGVMDMLRFQQFTIGREWKSDYGLSENPDEFKALYAYSPYHNIKEGTKYPWTLVTTSDHDDRVVPGHSFKFAAALQHAQAGDNPVLIRIETSAGHGAGKPTGKRIDEAADLWSFLVKALDFTPTIPAAGSAGK